MQKIFRLTDWILLKTLFAEKSGHSSNIVGFQEEHMLKND